MKYKIRIPANAVSPAIADLEKLGLIGTEKIGQVHLTGDWNNWGDSPQRPGCIRPTPETLMELQDEVYVLEIDVPVGLHDCKPVVVKCGAYADGMVAAVWISCPESQVGRFRQHGRHSNWQFVVR